MQHLLTRLFPTPSFVTLPTVGLDFSDATMRFIELKQGLHGIMPSRFEEVTIPDGCMKGGRIIDGKMFTDFLTGVRKKYNLHYVRVAMPESQTYSFTVSLDSAVGKNIRDAIELVLEDNIPLKTTETVFDFHVISSNEKAIIVQVVAVAATVSANYLAAFTGAGLVPVSFELDGQAVARAVLPPQDKGSYMIVDFGANRTSITVVTNNTAVFTSTLEFGGMKLVEMLAKELSISADEAEQLKREHGLSATGEHRTIFSVLVGGVSTLRDEINKRYVYWHERKPESVPTVKTVYLCGGHSNMPGLADYLSVSLKLRVVQANPWINCVSFDDAIPRMPYILSMSYVTAIGLALTDFLYD